MVRVSVILPVYNCEDFLPNILNDLQIQSLHEIEFICIDDGSSDNCLKLLHEACDSDQRFKIFTQTNQGVSVARNSGIQNALGEFIGFVDADDRIPSDYFETLYNLALQNKTDCVITRYQGTQNGVPYESNHPFQAQTLFDRKRIEKEILPYFIEKDDLNPVWNKLFRKAILDTHTDIKFPPKMVFGEDGVFTMLFFKYAQSIFFDSYCGYQYVEMQLSATRNVLNKDFLAIAKQQLAFDFEQIIEFSLSSHQINQLKKQRFAHAVMAMINLYLNASLSRKQKVIQVKKVLNDKIVQDVFGHLTKDWFQKKTRFERAICRGIKLKSVFLLTILTEYSNHRNQ
ncbi:MAG: hypothetical protein RL607_514 [Bacteroidota bacterium]|jgi:glycosyltransferase involved in cell wall biosynthesis